LRDRHLTADLLERLVIEGVLDDEVVDHVKTAS
jgi:hypothetical protein